MKYNIGTIIKPYCSKNIKKDFEIDFARIEDIYTTLNEKKEIVKQMYVLKYFNDNRILGFHEVPENFVARSINIFGIINK